MTGFWDIDEKSGEIDDDGNQYHNSDYRINPDGDIEHLGDDGWETEPQEEFSLNLDDLDDDEF